MYLSIVGVFYIKTLLWIQKKKCFICSFKKSYDQGLRKRERFVFNKLLLAAEKDSLWSACVRQQRSVHLQRFKASSVSGKHFSCVSLEWINGDVSSALTEPIYKLHDEHKRAIKLKSTSKKKFSQTKYLIFLLNQ